MTPAVLSTKECWAYVGGRAIWRELLDHYGPREDLPAKDNLDRPLSPLRVTGERGDSYWLRELVDTTLKRAQMERSLVGQAAQARRASLS